jgi:hypothetical protein
MRTTAFFFFCIALVVSGHAQIKVDTGYTILAKGVDENKNPQPFIYLNNNMVIKENATGRTCSPVSMQFTLRINGETFRAANVKEAQKYLDRMKPKDIIYIENIKLPQDCFAPPKQIVITVM